MEKRKSSFSGFLDGYRASNITSNEPAINLHIEGILSHAQGLIDLLTINRKDQELIDALKKSYYLLQTGSVSISERLPLFAEAFSIYLDLHRQTIGKDEIEINQKVRKIVYHVLSIAEIIEDSRLSSFAIKVGESF